MSPHAQYKCTFLTHTVQMKQDKPIIATYALKEFLTHTVQMKLG